MGKSVGNVSRSKNLRLLVESYRQHYDIESIDKFVDDYCIFRDVYAQVYRKGIKKQEPIRPPDKWTVKGWLGLQEGKEQQNISSQKMKSIGVYVSELTDGDIGAYELDLKHETFREVLSSKIYKRQRAANEYLGGITGLHVFYKPSFMTPLKYCREILHVRDDGSFSSYYLSHEGNKARVREFNGIVSERDHYFILPGYNKEGSYFRERVIYLSRKNNADYHGVQFGIVASTSPYNGNDLVSSCCVSFFHPQKTRLSRKALERNVIYLLRSQKPFGSYGEQLFSFLDVGFKNESRAQALGKGVLHIDASHFGRELNHLRKNKLITQVRRFNPVAVYSRFATRKDLHQY